MHSFRYESLKKLGVCMVGACSSSSSSSSSCAGRQEPSHTRAEAQDPGAPADEEAEGGSRRQPRSAEAVPLRL